MKKLYHATPLENAISIIETGIDPAYSRGRIARIWLADSEQIGWGIAHCALSHSVLVSDLIVFTAYLDKYMREITFVSPCERE